MVICDRSALYQPGLADPDIRVKGWPVPVVWDGRVRVLARFRNSLAVLAYSDLTDCATGPVAGSVNCTTKIPQGPIPLLYHHQRSFSTRELRAGSC